MTTEADEVPAHDAVVAIHKHTAWLTRDKVLISYVATEVQRALERALAESREARVTVIALVDGLLHALAKELLTPDLLAVDAERQVARFHLKATLDALVAAGLLTPEARSRLRQRMPALAEWLPEAGLGAVQCRFSFGGHQHRGFELDLAKARAFLKRTEAVPTR